MKGRQIILGRVGLREAAALMVDGRIEDILIDPAGATALAPGAICRGVTDRLMKGQGGVFLRLPDGQRGFLRDRSGLRDGQSLLVQVSGVAEPGKAIPLTARLLLRGRHVLVTPQAPGVNVSRRIRDREASQRLALLGRNALAGRDFGLIMRSAAEQAVNDDILADLTPLLDLADGLAAEAQGAPELLLAAPSPWDLAWTEWADPAPDAVEQGENSFEEFGILDALDQLVRPRLALPAGGSAMIEPCHALTAIDVNTGADTSPAAALKVNIALARDLPRQLRLRGLGGQIVVDFAPVPKRERATLDQVLRSAFRQEAAETTLIGWTAMGLYEISRKRDRARLTTLLADAS